MKEGKLVFDPRPKLLLLFTMGVFVLGNAGGDLFNRYTPLFCIVPMILFVLDGKWKTGVWYLILYAVAYGLYIGILPRLSGVIGYLLLACCGILTRFLPGIMTGSYLIRTTKVSEFNAAMERMHVSEKISIPLSVMFRFFPTVAEEWSAIGDAMRMRGVRFGGGKVGAILEYRIVPMMICSVKIGEELSQAALTRGLGGPVKRTNICKLGFHVQDVIFLLVCLGAFAAQIYVLAARG
mgnify:CR=1 FL=1